MQDKLSSGKETLRSADNQQTPVPDWIEIEFTHSRILTDTSFTLALIERRSKSIKTTRGLVAKRSRLKRPDRRSIHAKS